MAEIWDLYDAERRRTGKTMMRGEPVPRGFYTLSVSVWLTNGRGEYLLSKRHPAKKFPNLWECTGGGALAGEESLEAGVREVREELGIVLRPGRAADLPDAPRRVPGLLRRLAFPMRRAAFVAHAPARGGYRGALGLARGDKASPRRGAAASAARLHRRDYNLGF